MIEHHLKSWEAQKSAEVHELRESMYIEDLVSGKTTVEEAKEL